MKAIVSSAPFGWFTTFAELMRESFDTRGLAASSDLRLGTETTKPFGICMPRSSVTGPSKRSTIRVPCFTDGVPNGFGFPFTSLPVESPTSGGGAAVAPARVSDAAAPGMAWSKSSNPRRARSSR